MVGAEWEASSVGQGWPEQLYREPTLPIIQEGPEREPWCGLYPQDQFEGERAASVGGWWQTGSGTR